MSILCEKIKVGANNDVTEESSKTFLIGVSNQLNDSNKSFMFSNDSKLTDSNVSLCIGISNEITSSEKSLTIATNSIINGSNENVSLGNRLYSTGQKNVNIGNDISNNNQSSILIGNNNYSQAFGSKILGNNCIATGDSSSNNILIGKDIKCKGIYGIFLGNNINNNSHDIQCQHTTIIGTNVLNLKCDLNKSFILGNEIDNIENSIISDSFVIGNNNKISDSSSSFVLGNNNNTDSVLIFKNHNCFNIGNNSNIGGLSDEDPIKKSIILGSNSLIQASESFTIGNNSKTYKGGSYTIGNNSDSCGNNTFVIGNNININENLQDKFYIGGKDISAVEFIKGNSTVYANIKCGDVLSNGHSSDERIKRDVEIYPTKQALDNILNINSKSYIKKSFNGFKEIKETGFIAQELKNLFPDIVTTGSHYIPVDVKDYSFNNTSDNTRLYIPNLHFYNLNNKCKINVLQNNDQVSYQILYVEDNYIVLNNKINIDNIKLLGFKVNNFHYIEHTKLIPYLTSSIQELHKIIFRQQKDIEYLKSISNK